MPALRNLLIDHFSIKSLCLYLNMSLFYNSFQFLKTAELFFLSSAHGLIGDCTAAQMGGKLGTEVGVNSSIVALIATGSRCQQTRPLFYRTVSLCYDSAFLTFSYGLASEAGQYRQYHCLVTVTLRQTLLRLVSRNNCDSIQETYHSCKVVCCSELVWRCAPTLRLEQQFGEQQVMQPAKILPDCNAGSTRTTEASVNFTSAATI